MNTTMKVAFIALCCMLTLCAAPQDNGAARIGGTVFRGDTGQPLPGVEIRVAGRRGMTDAEGRFEMDGIQPGKHELAAVRDGYMHARLDRRPIPVQGIDITVNPGEDVRLTLYAQPAGAVTGRIYDSNGQPVRAVNIQTHRHTFDAMGEPSIIPLVDPLYRPPAAAVAGILRGDEVRALLQLPGTGDSRFDRTWRPDDRGEFRIFNLDPGVYDFYIHMGLAAASAYVAVVRSIHVGSGEEVRVGDIVVSAGRPAPFRPVDDVVFGRASLHGRAQMATEEGRVTPVSGVEIYLSSEEVVPARLIPIISGVDGTFSVSNFPAGRFHVGTSVTPPGMCIEEIVQGGRDVLRDGLVAESQPSPFNVTLGPARSKLQGSVFDAAGGPVPTAVVVAVPENRAQIGLYAFSRTDQHGAFEFPCVLPGDYRVYTWYGMESYAYRNAEFMQDYNERGRPLRIEASSEISLDLPVLDR